MKKTDRIMCLVVVDLQCASRVQMSGFKTLQRDCNINASNSRWISRFVSVSISSHYEILFTCR